MMAVLKVRHGNMLSCVCTIWREAWRLHLTTRAFLRSGRAALQPEQFREDGAELHDVAVLPDGTLCVAVGGEGVMKLVLVNAASGAATIYYDQSTVDEQSATNFIEFAIPGVMYPGGRQPFNLECAGADLYVASAYGGLWRMCRRDCVVLAKAGELFTSWEGRGFDDTERKLAAYEDRLYVHECDEERSSADNECWHIKVYDRKSLRAIVSITFADQAIMRRLACLRVYRNEIYVVVHGDSSEGPEPEDEKCGLYVFDLQGAFLRRIAQVGMPLDILLAHGHIYAIPAGELLHPGWFSYEDVTTVQVWSLQGELRQTCAVPGATNLSKLAYFEDELYVLDVGSTGPTGHDARELKVQVVHMC